MYIVPSDSIERYRVTVETMVLNGDNGIERMHGITDAAGIQKQGLAPFIHQRTMGMTEEEEVQIFFLCGIAGIDEAGFDPVGVPVAQQNPFSVQVQHDFRGFLGAVITVAWYLDQGNLWKALMEGLSISPAVPQMENHLGGGVQHCLLHMRDISVRVRKD